MRTAAAGCWMAVLLCSGFVGLAGCRSKEPPAAPPEPGEARETQQSAPSALTVEPPASRPSEPIPPPVATRPAATAPAKPASTYENSPPYPVNLSVRSPNDPQPGWLKILSLNNEQAAATANGVFPEKNEFTVATDNVRELRIHVGHLPLAANKRVILHIDGQHMVISRQRQYTTLVRQNTGEWTIKPGDAD